MDVKTLTTVLEINVLILIQVRVMCGAERRDATILEASELRCAYDLYSMIVLI